jgi:hypothetical protein
VGLDDSVRLGHLTSAVDQHADRPCSRIGLLDYQAPEMMAVRAGQERDLGPAGLLPQQRRRRRERHRALRGGGGGGGGGDGGGGASDGDGSGSCCSGEAGGESSGSERSSSGGESEDAGGGWLDAGPPGAPCSQGGRRWKSRTACVVLVLM